MLLLALAQSGKQLESGQGLNSFLRYFVFAFFSFILGLSVSKISNTFLLESERSPDLSSENRNINPHRQDSFVSKLKKLVSSLAKQKSQEEIISELPFYVLRRKLEEFEKIHRELIKERLDPNDVFAKSNPNQVTVNDFTRDFINSKKEWLKKIIFLDDSRKNNIVIFSKVEKCKWTSRLNKVSTFESSHCYDQSIFFNIDKKWIQHGRTGGIFWDNYYKNKPFNEMQLSDIKELERFRIIYIYTGLEDNNDEVFGLLLENDKYFWKDFSSTNWEEVTDVEKKQFVSEVEKLQ